jgi:hypothetical protein
MQTYVNKIMDRIIENTDTTTNVGMIIASPSNDPPYKYHWIRDSALVMRPIIDMYKQTKEPIYFQHIINYLENESKIQKLQTLTGLGEPKININGTPFDEPWGRPQNDGPALRGIICCSLIECFQYKYDTLIETLIVPMIQKDIEYTLANYDKPCFDLWEEHMGWHFYTRMVQLKFIKRVKNTIIISICWMIYCLGSHKPVVLFLLCPFGHLFFFVFGAPCAFPTSFLFMTTFPSLSKHKPDFLSLLDPFGQLGFLAGLAGCKFASTLLGTCCKTGTSTFFSFSFFITGTLLVGVFSKFFKGSISTIG